MYELLPFQTSTLEVPRTDIITVNPVDSYLSTLSPIGRKTQKARINSLSRILLGLSVASHEDYLLVPWASFRRPHYEQILAKLKQALNDKGKPLYSDSHIKTTWMGLRKIAEHAWSLGQISSEDYLRIKSIKTKFNENKLSGRAVKPDESRLIVDYWTTRYSLTGDLSCKRNESLFAILALTGMRRSELARLKIGDYNDTGRKFLFYGKGAKLQERHLPEQGVQYLKVWLEYLPDDPNFPIFPYIKRDGTLVKRSIDGQLVYSYLQVAVKNLGLEHSSPHDFRKGLATHLLNDGVDLVALRDILGHESVSTTQKYIRNDEKVLREVANRISF